MLSTDDIKTVAIFRALQLGDLLCSIPAIRALRKGLPHAHIAIIGLPWQKMLVERYGHYFDEFILFPGYPGLPEQLYDARATTQFLADMQERKFDLAIQMQGNGSIVNPMIELFNARHTAGFFRKEDYTPPGPYFILYPQKIPEIHRHLLLMEKLGFSTAGDDLEFPLYEDDKAGLQNTDLDLAPGSYVCIHAGSRGHYRQWPPVYFAKIADHCFEMGYKVVLTGTREEMPIVKSVEEHMSYTPVIAAGKTSLGSIGVLLKNSAGLISNCTGVSHIASALKVKSVVISMDGEPERWWPLDRSRHLMIDWIRYPDFEYVKNAVDQQFSSLSLQHQ